MDISLKEQTEDFPTFQFTPRSEESFYSVVDNPAFFERDAKLIYYALQKQLKIIPFGDYLKRYIYRKAEIKQPFEMVPMNEYLNIITDSFTSRGVPVSFGPSVAKIRSMAKNWIIQSSVSRDVVLLLGFGLRMQPEDVEELLKKGLSEPGLNLMDERECICAYCYKQGFGYYKYESLMQAGSALSAEKDGISQAVSLSHRIRSIEEIRTEEELLRHIAMLKNAHHYDRPELEARRQFCRLYRQAQGTTAFILNSIEIDSAEPQCKAAEDELPEDRLKQKNPEEKAPLQTEQDVRKWKPEEITPADVERVLQAATPRDQYGNMISMKKSTLNFLLRGRRMSRQRLGELLSGEAQVTRYDLIMLEFFVFSQEKKENESKLRYYYRFISQTNKTLAMCGMGPLYTANPFECFLLMCILSEDPLGTYADVIEQSYAEAAI